MVVTLARHRAGRAALAAGAQHPRAQGSDHQAAVDLPRPALFISNFLPTTIGGDVLRVSRISSENGETPRTFASVVLERLTGWAVLPFITLAALAINPTLLHLPGGDRPIRVAITVSVLTLALLAVVLAAAGHPSLGGRLAAKAGWRRFTGAIHLGRGPVPPADPWPRPRCSPPGSATSWRSIAAAFLAGRALGLRRRMDRVHGVHAGRGDRPGAAVPDHRRARSAGRRAGPVPRPARRDAGPRHRPRADGLRHQPDREPARRPVVRRRPPGSAGPRPSPA